MYALNIGTDVRILSATYSKYAAPDAVIVDHLPSKVANPERDENGHIKPESDLTNYRFPNGEYVYDPTPTPEQPEAVVSMEERMTAAEAEITRLATAVDVELADADAALRELGAEWEETDG